MPESSVNTNQLAFDTYDDICAYWQKYQKCQMELVK